MSIVSVQIYTILFISCSFPTKKTVTLHEKITNPSHNMQIVYSMLAVFIGSGLGGVLRWAIGLWANGQHPWGTLFVNVMGCLILGFLSRVAPGDVYLKLLLTTGFCGGFTTFSTFVNENVLMMRVGQLPMALGYMALSLILGLLAAWAGYSAHLR